jgi:hypothetical protein
MKALAPLALAGMLAFAGCAVHEAAVPAGAASAAVPQKAPKAPVSPTSPPERPATVVVAGAEPVGSPAAKPESGPAPLPTVVPAPPGKAAAGEAPPPTASAYVFSPQQAVSARPAPAPGGTAPTAAVAPAATTTGGATPAPEAPQQAKPEPSPEPSPSPSPQPSGQLQLAVVASPREIAPGGIVTVDVMVSSDVAVLDAPLHLSFDPAVVSFVDGAPGDFLAQGGSSIVFLSDGLSRPGDVAVAAGRVDRGQGAAGDGLLCRVHFRGIAAGTSPLTVAQAKAWGVHGETLKVVAGGTAVAVR